MMEPIQFYIKSSNDLSLLTTELISEMQSHQPSVFQPRFIVTQTEGMNNWLREKIALKQGVAANIEFLRPNDLIHKIYFALGGKYQDTLSPDELSWLLFDALIQPPFKEKFPDVHAYYAPGMPESDTKRMELARKLADLFDQYQVYRQDILKDWENDRLSTQSPEEQWQKDLWLVVRNKTGAQFPSKAFVRDFIFQKCDDPTSISILHEKLPAIFIFGTVLITEYHRDLLLKLSSTIPVYLFLPNPAPDIYWYEDKSRRQLFYDRRKGKSTSDDNPTNPLLTDWGKLIQNTFRLLFNNDEVINLYEGSNQVLSQKDTLLHNIQHYLSLNEVPQGAHLFSDELLKDHSVTIQSCYSPAREIQSLYNFLVQLMDQNPGSFSSRDIVVQVTDINLYASYIRSVFDNAPYRFQYTIADETYTSTDSLSGALYALLTMDEKDLDAESVLQLLDFSDIRRRFKITDTEFIRAVVKEANIRHGAEGTTINDSLYVSWKYGLQRIMYGICISGGERFGSGDESFFPLDSLEGAGTANVIHFCYFAEKLIHFVEEKQQQKTLVGWAAYLTEVIHHFLADREKNDEEEYRLLVKQIEKISDIEQYLPDPISFPVFARQFLGLLDNSIHEYRYSTGGITFCSLIPMRSIPFKIVAMLGLDFDKFPRKGTKTSFDLMVLHPRPGDRNVKEHDKHLFLETIMSAGDYLYLSYKGQSIQDNSSRPPSILMDQFISFIESYSENSDHVIPYLLTKQPLHNFSNLYGSSERYYNYLLTDKKAPDIRTSDIIRAEENKTIPLNDFLSFFKEPVRYYYNKILHIYYEEQSYTLPDSELFELDELGKWSLKMKWLLDKNANLEDFTKAQIQLGNLPLKNSGKLEMQELASELDDFKTAFYDTIQNENRSVLNLSLDIAGYHIEGAVGNIYGDKAICLNFSKHAEKNLLITYVTALLLAAGSYDYQSTFMQPGKILNAKKISSEKAQEYVRELLTIYQEGRKRAIYFFPDWDLDLEKIQSLNTEKIITQGKKNEYLKKEIETREEGSISEEYKDVGEKILKGFKEIF